MGLCRMALPERRGRNVVSAPWHAWEAHPPCAGTRRLPRSMGEIGVSPWRRPELGSAPCERGEEVSAHPVELVGCEAEAEADHGVRGDGGDGAGLAAELGNVARAQALPRADEDAAVAHAQGVRVGFDHGLAEADPEGAPEEEGGRD